MLDSVRNKIQTEALHKWIEKDKKGTCEIITGLGKTFISLHALYTMPKNDGKIHLFLAEATDRIKDLKNDIDKFNKLFDKNVLEDYNLHFYCYQTVYKWKGRNDIGLVIADEIHDSLTPAYSKFYFNNKYDAIIGLSATINTKTLYETEIVSYTKGDLLNKIAPICFKYTVKDGQKDGTTRELEIFVINHELDNKNKTIEAGNKKKRFYQTEDAAYSYWDKQHKTAWFISDEETKKLKIRITSHKRSNILYNLPSKIAATKEILKHLKSKTIIFSNSLDSLYKVTNNVVSSRNTDAENTAIRDNFEKGITNVIGSFKKLKQGANLNNVDNCIIMSYYSTDKDFIQRIGRLRKNNKIGRVFIFVTKNTQEEVWFNKIFSNISNLKMFYFNNLKECINHIKK